MKKLLSAFLIATSFILLTSAVPAVKLENSTFAKTEKSIETKSTKMTVGDMVKMSSKEFSVLKGSKITFKEKLVLKITQRQLKKEIKAGRLSKDKELDVKSYMDNEMPKFNIGGFLLGLLLGLIGVGLAHIFSNSKSFRRSSWYGFGALLIIVLITAL